MKIVLRTMKNKINISWEQYGQMLDELVERVKQSNEKFDGVYGVPRGGMIISVMMSHRLKIPILHYPTENTLVCDDLSDTGKTLQNLKHKKIACLFTSDWTKTSPDFFIKTKINQDSWLIFPYEDEVNENG